MRLEIVALPELVHTASGNTDLFGHGTHAPASLASRGLSHTSDDCCDLLFTKPARPAASFLILQPFQATQLPSALRESLSIARSFFVPGSLPRFEKAAGDYR